MVSSHATWRNPRILAMLLMVFLAGGFIGAWTMRQIHRRIHETPTFQPKNGTLLSYDQLKDQLNLSPDQSQKLKSILDDFVKYNQELQSQIEDYRATGKNRIRSILNPSQQQQFEKLCDQIR
jgi:Spy/CpxP family protein refolding chaperone